MDFLRIVNWDRWQSYRSDRSQPPWIKVHRRVMHNIEWLQLTDAQRGQLVSMWLLAAERNGTIPAQPEIVQKLCCMNETPDLQVFIRLGFMKYDGEPESLWRQDDANMTPTRRQDDANMTHQTRQDKTRLDQTRQESSVSNLSFAEGQKSESHGKLVGKVSWLDCISALHLHFAANATIENFRLWLAQHLVDEPKPRQQQAYARLLGIIDASQTKRNPPAWFIGAVKRASDDGGFGYRPTGRRTAR